MATVKMRLRYIRQVRSSRLTPPLLKKRGGGIFSLLPFFFLKFTANQNEIKVIHPTWTMRSSAAHMEFSHYEKLQAPNYSRTTTIFNRGQNKKCLVRCVEKKQQKKRGTTRRRIWFWFDCVKYSYVVFASSLSLSLSLWNSKFFFCFFPLLVY